MSFRFESWPLFCVKGPSRPVSAPRTFSTGSPLVGRSGTGPDGSRAGFVHKEFGRKGEFDFPSAKIFQYFFGWVGLGAKRAPLLTKPGPGPPSLPQAQWSGSGPEPVHRGQFHKRTPLRSRRAARPHGPSLALPQVSGPRLMDQCHALPHTAKYPDVSKSETVNIPRPDGSPTAVHALVAVVGPAPAAMYHSVTVAAGRPLLRLVVPDESVKSAADRSDDHGHATLRICAEAPEPPDGAWLHDGLAGALADLLSGAAAAADLGADADGCARPAVWAWDPRAAHADFAMREMAALVQMAVGAWEADAQAAVAYSRGAVGQSPAPPAQDSVGRAHSTSSAEAGEAGLVVTARCLEEAAQWGALQLRTAELEQVESPVYCTLPVPLCPRAGPPV